MLRSFEKGKEHIPTSEEIMVVFKELVRSKEIEELRKVNDEKGLYLWEIKILGEKEGEHIEYLYRRKGIKETEEQRKGCPTAIHITYFEDDYPVTGTTAASYNEETGLWKIIK